MATLNISLPDEMRARVDAQVASGRYANASDYIRDLIRRNQGEKEAIRLALLQGEQSGTSDMTIQDILVDKRRNRSRG